MAVRTLPGLGLNGGYDSGEDGWTSTMNLNLLKLSTVTQLKALSRTVVLPGSPSNGDIYIVPSGVNANQVAVRDNGAWVYFAPGVGWRAWVVDEAKQIVWDGVAWTTPLAPLTLGAFSPAAPTASQILLDYVCTEAAMFPDDFAGSRASCSTNPAADFVANIQKNDSNVGTVTISSTGVVTFATIGTTVSFAVGDVLSIVAPSSPDASITRLRITLKGTR